MFFIFFLVSMFHGFMFGSQTPTYQLQTQNSNYSSEQSDQSPRQFQTFGSQTSTYQFPQSKSYEECLAEYKACQKLLEQCQANAETELSVEEKAANTKKYYASMNDRIIAGAAIHRAIYAEMLNPTTQFFKEIVSAVNKDTTTDNLSEAQYGVYLAAMMKKSADDANIRLNTEKQQQLEREEASKK